MWMLGGCGRCGGDLAPEFDEMRCVQCGRRLYPNQPVFTKTRKHTVHHADRAARWDEKNAEIVEALKRGLTPKEAAVVFGKTARYVRKIREMATA